MIAFFNVAYSLCALAGYATAVYKVRDLRRDPANPALIALTVARLFPALSFTFAIPAVYLAFDRLTGVDNLASLMVYVLMVANSVTAQVLLLLWSRPAATARAAVRWRLTGFGVVMAATVALFLAASHQGEHAIDFDVTFARQWSTAAFLVLYLTAFAVGLALSARMTWRFSRVVTQRWLRRGLVLNAVGAGLGLAYAAGKMVSIVARWLGSDALDLVNILWAPAIACVGAILIAVSSSLPAWAPDVEAAVVRWRRYRRLEPLWRAVRDAKPAVVLDPRTGRLDRWDPRRLDERLYRRVIEIRDGLLAARPGFSEPAAARARARAAAAGLPPEELAAVAEAARIAPALHLAPRWTAEPDGADPSAQAPEPPVADDADAEAEWLCRVAYALDRSPYVG
ncbi:MAB_1171c family putative transporter [Dactylosporangium sp. NPDC051485]|uniref:MAB_1171c family putative transporter n=1 Tax=Dactylosporangium sp. NPDC051485 TaxID=3154846 RepID=UPI003435D452